MDNMKLAQHRLGIFLALKKGIQDKMGGGSALEAALIKELTQHVGQVKTSAIAADLEKVGEDKNDLLIAILAINVDETTWCKCLDQAAAVAMSTAAANDLTKVDVRKMAKELREMPAQARNNENGEAALKAPYHLFFFSAVDLDERSRFFDIMKQEDGFTLAETGTAAPRLGACVESVYEIAGAGGFHHVHRNYGKYCTDTARSAMEFFAKAHSLTQVTDIAETHNQVEAGPTWAAIFQKLGCPVSNFSFTESKSFEGQAKESRCVISLLPERLPSTFETIECASLEVFFALGIVNPAGPTFSFVAAVGDWEAGKVLPVVNVMLNPFSQSVEEVARLTVGATWEPMNDLEPLIELGFGSCPTLVLVSARIPEALRVSFAAKILETFGQRVVVVHERVSFHLGDPWTRVEEMMKGVRPGTTSPLTQEEACKRLAQLVLQPEHIWPESHAFLFAWNGAIHKTGIPEQMAAEAFPYERFGKFLLERVYPTLWLPPEPNQEPPAGHLKPPHRESPGSQKLAFTSQKERISGDTGQHLSLRKRLLDRAFRHIKKKPN